MVQEEIHKNSLCSFIPQSLQRISPPRVGAWFSFPSKITNSLYPVGIFDSDFNLINLEGTVMTMSVSTTKNSFKIDKKEYNNSGIFYFCAIHAHTTETVITIQFDSVGCASLVFHVDITGGFVSSALFNFSTISKLDSLLIPVLPDDNLTNPAQMKNVGNCTESCQPWKMRTIFFKGIGVPIPVMRAFLNDEIRNVGHVAKFMETTSANDKTFEVLRLPESLRRPSCRTLFKNLQAKIEHSELIINTLLLSFDYIFEDYILYRKEKVAFASCCSQMQVFKVSFADEFGAFYFLRFLFLLMNNFCGSVSTDACKMRVIVKTALDMLNENISVFN